MSPSWISESATIELSVADILRDGAHFQNKLKFYTYINRI